MENRTKLIIGAVALGLGVGCAIAFKKKPSPECSCTVWQDGECVSETHRAQTRVCTPAGCKTEHQEVIDASCAPGCVCGDWVPGECVDNTHRKQTRVCDPPVCAHESRDIEDPTCAPARDITISVDCNYDSGDGPGSGLATVSNNSGELIKIWVGIFLCSAKAGNDCDLNCMAAEKVIYETVPAYFEIDDGASQGIATSKLKNILRGQKQRTGIYYFIAKVWDRAPVGDASDIEHCLDGNFCTVVFDPAIDIPITVDCNYGGGRGAVTVTNNTGNAAVRLWITRQLCSSVVGDGCALHCEGNIIKEWDSHYEDLTLRPSFVLITPEGFNELLSAAGQPAGTYYFVAAIWYDDPATVPDAVCINGCFCDFNFSG